MPVSTSILSNVSPNDTIEADDLRLRFQELERFVNGGIEKNDLKERNVFQTRHIVKPEFYSIANNRILGISSDTFYRNMFFSGFNRYVRHECTGSYNTGSESFSVTTCKSLPHNAWTPIDGMASTVSVKDPDPASPGDTVTAFVNGSLYAYGSGSDDGVRMKLEQEVKNFTRNDDGGFTPSTSQISSFRRALASGNVLGAFMLFVDKMDGNGPQAQKHTFRLVYNSGQRSYKFRRQQISFATNVVLTPGQNKISYRCIYRMTEETSISQKHLYIDNRNFLVDVHYK